MDSAGDFIAELALDLVRAKALDGLSLHDLLLFYGEGQGKKGELKEVSDGYARSNCSCSASLISFEVTEPKSLPLLPAFAAIFT